MFISDAKRYITYLLSQLALLGTIMILVMTTQPAVTLTFHDMFVDDFMADTLKLMCCFALSVLLAPESLAAVMSGAAAGAPGAVASIVIGSAVLLGDSLPAALVTVVVMTCGPSVKAVVGVRVPATGS